MDYSKEYQLYIYIFTKLTFSKKMPKYYLSLAVK
jgi:hypothetical protein